MRVEHPLASTDRDRQRRAEIEDAIVRRQIEGRICSVNCTITCTECGASACQCMCSANCPDMPSVLSSDPDRHPIEPAVAHPVFAMKQIAAFQTCWSCEGHLGLDGKIWKIPRVWFYCESMVAVRLLTDGLNSNALTEKLHASWRIAVTFSEPDNVETTFSLEPVQPLDEAVNLPALQEDLSTIADTLSTLMIHQAYRLHREMAADAKQGG